MKQNPVDPEFYIQQKILSKNEGKINAFFPGKQNLRDRHVLKQQIIKKP